MQTITFSELLVRTQNMHTENPGSSDWNRHFCRILPVVGSYVDDETLRLLMQVSRRVLQLITLDKIHIPLSLCVNRDFADSLLQAKSRIEILKHTTNLSFSLSLCICSEGKKLVEDVLRGLNLLKDGDVVRSIAIQNLQVDRQDMNKLMGKCISSMKKLKRLDLSGYYCNNVEFFQDFVSELTTLRTLQEVAVDLCSLQALPTLSVGNTDLNALTVYATGGDGDRTPIFSILSELTLVGLKTFSMHKLRVVREEESEKLQEFVRRHSGLWNLSWVSCKVLDAAYDPFLGLLEHPGLQTLELHRLGMQQSQLRRVLGQILNMTQLKGLKLTHNHVFDPEAFCSGLSNMKLLRSLNLSYFCLNAQSVSKLAEALTNLRGLQQLDLSNNQFYDINVSPFVDAVTKLSKLTRLRLDNCGMTEGVRRQMQTVLQKKI